MKKLIEVQSELKAPKNQYNSFGKYNYRSKEDILEAVKPLLAKHGLLMTLTDEVKEIAGLPFVETIIRVEDGKDYVESRGVAGIEKSGGMNLAQAFGSASSYSGKYALGNMFLLDDTKDADATNDHGKPSPKVTKMVKPITGTAQKQELKPNTEQWEKAIGFLIGGGLISAIEGKYALDKVNKQLLMDTVLEKA